MFRRMNYVIATAALSVSVGAIMARAQETTAPRALAESVYCGGVVTTEHVNTDIYVVSGPEEQIRTTFPAGRDIYISRGSSQGVKVGDEFLASRPVSDKLRYQWFHGQESLAKAMGTTYADLGRVRVVHVEPNTAIAEVVSSCSYLQRGDILQPFSERTAPPVRKGNAAFDVFAAPSGKATGMIVFTRGFGQVVGNNSVVYVNLGGAQGVKVGDFFRIFRYHDRDGHKETIYNVRDTTYKLYGYGATPRPYSGSELPREVLAEGVVLRVGPNASTVLVTRTERASYVGDYAELE
jgi:hypothetical protein